MPGRWMQQGLRDEIVRPRQDDHARTLVRPPFEQILSRRHKGREAARAAAWEVAVLRQANHLHSRHGVPDDRCVEDRINSCRGAAPPFPTRPGSRANVETSIAGILKDEPTLAVANDQ